jgi:hypothetical protein
LPDESQAFLEPVLRLQPRLRREVLRLVSGVRLDAAAGTARVAYDGHRIRLEIAPAFARRHLRRIADRLFVLRHELLHVAQGDLVREGRRYHRFPRLVNLALDVFVNGSLLQAHHARTGLDQPPYPLLRRLYPARALPAALLLPPNALVAAWAGRIAPSSRVTAAARVAVCGLGGRSRARQLPGGTPPLEAHVERIFSAILPGRPVRALARTYVAGWSRAVPFSTFLERLLLAVLDAGLLEDVEGLDLPLQHALDALGALAARAGGVAPGSSDVTGERVVDPAVQAARADQRALLLRALREALVDGPAPGRRAVPDARVLPGVLPHLGRREAALLACGVLPVFCSASQPALRPPEQRVHLYLDVSGSMDALLPFLYGLVGSLRDVLSTPIYLFSNQVHEITLAELAAGRVRTTGGTDLDCVAAHAREHGVKRLLVITDGYLSLAPETREHLGQRVEAFAVLTREHRGVFAVHDLDAVFRRTWSLAFI